MRGRPPLARAVSWLVEEQDDEEEERRLVPPTMIPGPRGTRRQASVDRSSGLLPGAGSPLSRSRQPSIDRGSKPVINRSPSIESSNSEIMKIKNLVSIRRNSMDKGPGQLLSPHRGRSSPAPAPSSPARPAAPPATMTRGASVDGRGAGRGGQRVLTRGFSMDQGLRPPSITITSPRGRGRSSSPRGQARSPSPRGRGRTPSPRARNLLSKVEEIHEQIKREEEEEETEEVESGNFDVATEVEETEEEFHENELSGWWSLSGRGQRSFLPL